MGLKETLLYKNEGIWEVDVVCGDIRFHVLIHKEDQRRINPWVCNIFQPRDIGRPAYMRDGWYPSAEVALATAKEQIARACSDWVPEEPGHAS